MTNNGKIKPDDLAIDYTQTSELLNMMSSLRITALKAGLNDIMFHFMYDRYNNCNENVEITIKTLKDFQCGLTK